jgi:ribose/xylose/arabinose/galactoside ABC-type transport system permease subunit
MNSQTSLRERLIYFSRSQTLLLILIVIFIVCAIAVPGFGSERTMMNILKSAATIGLISLGLSVAVVGGTLDLSVGSVFSFMCVLSVKMQNTDPLLGIVVPLIVAVGIGCLNGYLITRFRLNSIIVTLGTMSVFAGIALLYSPTIMVVPNTWYDKVANTQIAGLPSYVWIFFAVAVVLQIILFKTGFGKSLYYTGVNPDASEIAGINKNRTIIISMIICALCVAIAAILQTSHVGTGYPISGVGFEFDALTAVLIGGISIMGGKGSALRAVLGVIMLQAILSATLLIGLTHDWQSIIKGLLVLAALSLDARQQLLVQGAVVRLGKAWRE